MRYEVGQRLVTEGGNERDRADLPEHWLIHPFPRGEEVEVLAVDRDTDEYDHPIYLVEAVEDGIYAYVSEFNLRPVDKEGDQ